MKYLINQYVTYDSFHGVLYASNDDNIIKLTTTLNRLLLILVQNNGAILAREDLLHRVWKEHNQVVSDNNLNSSISVLRRHLSCFFKEDIIITIPKVGVKFSVNEVLELPPTKNENSKLDLLMPYLESNKESSIENTKKRSEVYNEENKINPGVVIKNNIKIGKHFTEILLVVIIITIFIYVFKYYFFINRNEYPEIGQVD
nr:helix-turn-helix domain-containing protein [Providencia rettgeri]